VSDGRTADARLERLLHVLPAARRDGGAALADLAEALDTSPARILEDLEEVTARAFYQPGGWPDDVEILVEGDRVRVRHAAGFERPARLSRDETLCLALALRGAPAAARVAGDEARAALLRRAEAHIGRSLAATGAADPIDAPERAPDPEGIRETLMTSARRRRPCAIWYVKPGAADGSVRVVHPYAIAYAEGAWYAVSHCTVEEAIRVFRMDRVLAADVADGAFEVPDGFRVADYLDEGRVHDGAAGLHVRIRYSAKIARWLRERARWEPERVEDDRDGAIVVRHEVSDPQWAVAHALTYGAEAEVVEPEEVRALVRDAVRGLVG
jgi:predicted DNA-binding transcriptional regulator YafY